MVGGVLTEFLGPFGHTEPKLTGSQIQDVSNEWEGFRARGVDGISSLVVSGPDVKYGKNDEA